MNFSYVTAFVLGVFLMTCVPAFAQTSLVSDEQGHEVLAALEENVNPYAAVFEPEEGELAVTYIEDPQALFTLLTDPDACPIGVTQARRVPCALVADGELRPIFKIEGPERIWTLVRGELALVSVEDLWHVRKFDVPFDPYNPQRTSDVLGFAQNKSNCKIGGASCVPEERFSAFGRGNILTSGCVTLIWNGTPARCKYLEPSVP